jgi:zinc transport system substrate-binding protein
LILDLDMRISLTLFLFLLASPCFAAPKIVVSIAPIHSLVSLLTKGISEPKLLLKQGGSPHSSSLRPSQARALAGADLLIWVGPELESFLTVPVGRLVQPKAEMQLLKLEGLELLAQRHGGLWEEDQHADESTHDNHSINPHIWLSPDNARYIVSSISQHLIQIDPKNAAAYRQNEKNLQRRVDLLELALSEQLTPIRAQPYLVFHDAYPYFEAAFSLNAVGSVRISAERAPGARRLQQIKAKVSGSAAVCLFSEPQFSPALAASLAKDSGLKLGELDPLGSTIDQGADSWFILMKGLAANLVDCLTKEPR